MNLDFRKVDSGERINLEKENPGLKKYRVGLFWEKREDGADLDASVIVLDKNEKILRYPENSNSECVCFYNQKEILNGALKHSGDAREGSTTKNSEDLETIHLDLSKLPTQAETLLLVATSHDKQNTVTFGKVRNASFRLYNGETGDKLYAFDLSEDASMYTSVIIAKLYKKDGEWKSVNSSEPVGKSPEGLRDVYKKYSTV